jgi:hypothetical protein
MGLPPPGLAANLGRGRDGQQAAPHGRPRQGTVDFGLREQPLRLREQRCSGRNAQLPDVVPDAKNTAYRFDRITAF